ncbi:DNA excision repair protein ERCC-6-like [Macadamia integrifolia]|uniref:DNA excision repair protein ERCC-6-like n=1 Tax=Macadamia integrifolia TaxID=60698 RepID=UPI001C4FB45A|nr:DNA excision repair protein ERCC-6-like [Macadamia integrifolia]
MRFSSKPISSPGRADKFPPPLTRFLRSNVGSRSRGRSRSSPMFVQKKNASAAVETQEPSSPKVTCMGQVRVRRSKQARVTKPSRSSTTTATKRRFRWIRKAFMCNSSIRKLKPKSSRPIWRKWFLFLQVGYRRKVDSAKDSAVGESKREETDEEDTDRGDGDEEEEEEEEEDKVFVSSSPPKNALLLMRSRSAPYRASSLANRFWGSPSPIEDAADGKKKQETINRVETEDGEEKEEEERPTSGNEVTCRDSATESRKSSETEEKLGLSDGLQSSSSERTTITIGTGKMPSKLMEGGGSAQPLVLTRCKSEPGRRTGTGTGRFDPEMSFWKKPRLRLGEKCPPHVYD